METKDRIRRMRGMMSRAKFSEKHGIPQRTLEDWESGARTPAEYVVEMLAREIALEKVKVTAWCITDMRDNYSDGDTDVFATKEEAVSRAMSEWNGMTARDRARRDLFYVALYEMEYDEASEEYWPLPDPLIVAWDALA